jgi:hypothetical protein
MYSVLFYYRQMINHVERDFHLISLRNLGFGIWFVASEAYARFQSFSYCL